MVFERYPFQIFNFAHLKVVPGLLDEFCNALVLFIVIYHQGFLYSYSEDPIHLNKFGQCGQAQDEHPFLFHPLLLNELQHGLDELLDEFLVDLVRFARPDDVFHSLDYLLFALVVPLGILYLLLYLDDCFLDSLPQVQIHVEVNDLQDLRLVYDVIIALLENFEEISYETVRTIVQLVLGLRIKLVHYHVFEEHEYVLDGLVHLNLLLGPHYLCDLRVVVLVLLLLDMKMPLQKLDVLVDEAVDFLNELLFWPFLFVLLLVEDEDPVEDLLFSIDCLDESVVNQPDDVPLEHKPDLLLNHVVCGVIEIHIEIIRRQHLPEVLWQL